ncbi:hypothetical protein IR083_09735 [Dysgonomonas sp. GY75]|uniref:hypothetical protein n=1 Tax=Dysgonomonas sp. GY75 TaxID=2780419 RepID=UPI0018835058|nr:hypothetical protein [Dysgonomonas sp. GY75]MBF0649100.1 hypothetical protein [Dysgonomonas sp. GY75]
MKNKVFKISILIITALIGCCLSFYYYKQYRLKKWYGEARELIDEWEVDRKICCIYTINVIEKISVAYREGRMINVEIELKKAAREYEESGGKAFDDHLFELNKNRYIKNHNQH